MKIRELEALRAIFDTGSVSHAARSIGVTQSGVSRMLASCSTASADGWFRRAPRSRCATK